MKGKVFVGLSGGVDSAVSAALLKKEGYDVTGVFIKIWQPQFIECTWEKDRLDAMRVAVSLGVPFREIDLSDAYLRNVVEEMTTGYASGYTPNPDVSCNERIKFGAYADWAFQNGAEYVATGHYARVENTNGEHQLLRGTDPEKDQSYFLYRIPRPHLRKVLFPVGGYLKSEVRALARDLALPVAAKHDSQGLCFVGDVDMRTFLRRFIPIEAGDVLDVSGTHIGRHEGAALYTVGQRHGFALDGERGGSPHYVTAIDIRANTITVSPRKEDAMRTLCSLRDAHWLIDAPPLQAAAQARYREAPASVRLENAMVHFDTPHVLSPGQDIVFYDGERCLGGGKIA
jgi:tRNA-specific 2-thiouridylase